MSEIENGRLGVHVTEHLKCNHLMTVGFKGLNALLARDAFITRASCYAFAIDLCWRYCVLGGLAVRPVFGCDDQSA